MGIYDRDYYREQPRYRRRRKNPLANFSAVGLIIIVNVALFLLNGIFWSEGNQLTTHLLMTGEAMANPLQWYRLITYGFAHAPNTLGHIAGNMLTLFFLGRFVEMRYGKKEFLLIYFLSIFLCGLVWGLFNFNEPAAMLGASGAISTIVILFALNFPNVQLLLFFILPMPAWVLGVAYIVYDAFGAAGGQSNIAHGVHLTGAAFALLYFFSRWNFSRLLTMPKPGRKKTPRGKGIGIFAETDDELLEPDESASSLEREVDRILRKINQSGENSLSDQERATLRRASDEYQRRRR
ncbi:MAG: rhomboid family intramembrane serine protease [Planctomycetia bacterium]|nr:rhomboid family intramembrane serine protease [Planctomycetia bacterium]